MEKKYIDLYMEWQESPLAFVEYMWGLVPQPVKEQYFDDAQEAINTGDWMAFKPEWFEDFEKGRHVTWQQWVVFLMVERALCGLGSKRITVASGHGTGKDATAAMLILWYLFCFKDAQVPCTAPSSEQMYDVLWKEIAKWLYKMPQPAQDLYEWRTDYVRMREAPATWFARAKTARKENPEALAGVHGDFVFMVADEASGVAEEIFNTAEGALTNENIIVFLISNPTRLIGYFYDSHHEKCSHCSARRAVDGVWKGGDDQCTHEVVKAAMWQRVRFDSSQSPIVDHDFVEGIKAKHGLDSDEYKIRVKGTFADEDAVDDDGYVPLLKTEDLKQVADVGRWRSGWSRLGVDPSGQGKNETVWVIRDKFRSKIVAVEQHSTGAKIAEKTIAIAEMYSIPDWQITVDAFGVGTEAVQELALAGWRVLAINTGDHCEAEEDKELYVNVRACSGWRLRMWIKKGCELVRNKRWGQLTLVRYRRQLSGKLKIMDKLEMRKRGIPSPDAYDALSLTFVRDEKFEMRESTGASDQDINDATSAYNH